MQRREEEWTYLPKRAVIVGDDVPAAPASKAMAAKFDLLARNYRLIVSPKPSRLADRKVYQVSIQSRVGNAVARRLWIDPATGLVLRAENFHSDGTLAGVSYFSEINVHPKFAPNTFALSSLASKPARTIEQPDAPEEKVQRVDLDHALGGARPSPRSN